MERLGQRDLGVFLWFLREVYADLNLKSLVAPIASALPEIVPSEWTSYNEVDPQNQRVNVVMEPLPFDFPEREQVFERYVHEHLLVRHYQRTSDGRAGKISDFLTQRQSSTGSSCITSFFGG
jgi:hypothetical protein